MTLFFQNHQITIKRSKLVSGMKYALSATLTSYDIDIQPVNAERINQSGRVGKTYDAYIDDVDVKENDKIITEDGKSYLVKAVIRYNGAGLLDHKQLILESAD